MSRNLQPNFQFQNVNQVVKQKLISPTISTIGNLQNDISDVFDKTFEVYLCQLKINLENRVFWNERNSTEDFILKLMRDISMDMIDRENVYSLKKICVRRWRLVSYLNYFHEHCNDKYGNIYTLLPRVYHRRNPLYISVTTTAYVHDLWSV